MTNNKKPLELYVHIPFCVRKCAYCDFLSGPSTLEERQQYIKQLCQKIRSFREWANHYELVSIFVGGGTPSILEITLLEELFATVWEVFSVREDAEITLEMNPGTVTREKLFCYRDLGINRLSIGLQSVDNQALKILGRIHTYEDFLDTYQCAREVGFTNLNVDLMAAIPGQTLSAWHQTLRTVADLQPEHISAYSLIIEEGTPFYEQYGPEADPADSQDAPLPDEDTERQMYADTLEILEPYGYHRYEISNYAKEGYECRHNLGYWDRAEYLGVGKGAASLIQNVRFVEGEEPEKLSVSEQMQEFMFLGLRKMEGVSRKRFFEIFGQTMDSVYGEVIADLKDKQLLTEEQGFVRLTARGIDISNVVMSEF